MNTIKESLTVECHISQLPQFEDCMTYSACWCEQQPATPQSMCQSICRLSLYTTYKIVNVVSSEAAEAHGKVHCSMVSDVVEVELDGETRASLFAVYRQPSCRHVHPSVLTSHYLSDLSSFPSSKRWNLLYCFTLTACTNECYYVGRIHSRKLNVTVWRLSVCLSRRNTHRDSLGCSMRRSQRTFRPDNTDDRLVWTDAYKLRDQKLSVSY